MSLPADTAAAAQPPAPMPQAPPDPGSKAPAADAAPASQRSFLRAGWDKFRDNVVPGVIVGLGAGLALFSFTDLKSDVHRLEDSVSARFSELKGEIATDFAAVDARFTKLEDDIYTRFTKLEDDIDTRFTKLEDDIDADFAAVDARFTKLEDDIDADFAAVDARFTKLEENQQDIAVTLARLDSRLDAVVALLEADGDGER